MLDQAIFAQPDHLRLQVDLEGVAEAPKLFDMKAIRWSSGDQAARSPKPVSKAMFGGSLGSGLPGFRACGEAIGAATTAISPAVATTAGRG